jgi:hypothetical protein
MTRVVEALTRVTGRRSGGHAQWAPARDRLGTKVQKWQCFRSPSAKSSERGTCASVRVREQEEAIVGHKTYHTSDALVPPMDLP